MSWETVIGLEVHAHLLTRSKIFCACPNAFGAAPNSHTCPVCLGLPGALPVLNREVARMALQVALALECAIPLRSTFARKNYFYPDMPKGYQISQYEHPLARNGRLSIDTPQGPKPIGVNRIHLEDDAGKNVHPDDDAHHSLVDLNRSGAPLIEIVSEPELSSPQEAADYMRELRRLLRYLGVCDGNMEQGSLRCDANVSLRRPGARELGERTELKNLNSFRNVQRALQFEIERQTVVLDAGGRVQQQTRLFDAERGVTAPLRSKEEAHDYRYFPEPDLLPLAADPQWVERLRAELPELPRARQLRYAQALGLPAYDADVLSSEPEIAAYFDATVAAGADPKAASNWVMSEVLREVASPVDLAGLKLTPAGLAELLGLVASNAISGKMAKGLLRQVIELGGSPAELAKQQGLSMISDSAELERLVERLLAEHPEQVEQYRAGSKKVIGYLIGQAMRLSQGQADPQTLRLILERRLEG